MGKIEGMPEGFDCSTEGWLVVLCLFKKESRILHKLQRLSWAGTMYYIKVQV